MRMRTIEISVGGFVLAGIVALIFLAVQVSGVNTGGASHTYEITARFDDVAGLRERAKVSMAGVTVGRVRSIEVDMSWGDAVVTMEIAGEPGNLAADTGAKILTEGILGARYIGLSPGGDEETLAAGDEITETQGALVLENLIGDFLTNMGKS
ncbi:MAG: outer membrane lipid asymmetry maintenance protein MlaD [Gammaproteobacteria bacterium]|jgi:phospholipid/cholesterol/gamma-HCH transport system substrate-binding protein|nr:outer membrane lipid asymmetry maintenance protein MlaD [Gammaproteobacteria bacterium]